MQGFTHPLARDAKVWTTGGLDGAARKVLVIITTLELESGRPRHKPHQIERLTTAAREWIAAHPDDATDFLLMNRPKTWAGDKD